MEGDQKRGSKYTRAKHGGAAAILLIKNGEKKIITRKKISGTFVNNVCTKLYA